MVPPIKKNIFRRAQVVIYVISYVKTPNESIAAFRLSKIDRIDGVIDSSNFCRFVFLTKHRSQRWFRRSKNIFRRAQVVIYVISYVKTPKESIAAFRLSKIDRIDGVIDSSNFCRSVFLTNHRTRRWFRRSKKYIPTCASRDLYHIIRKNSQGIDCRLPIVENRPYRWSFRLFKFLSIRVLQNIRSVFDETPITKMVPPIKKIYSDVRKS